MMKKSGKKLPSLKSQSFRSTPMAWNAAGDLPLRLYVVTRNVWFFTLVYSACRS